MRYSFVAIPFVNEEDVQELVLSGQFEPSEDCAEGQLPDVVIGFSPDPAVVGEPAQFFDLSTSPGNSIVSWAWDFGDSMMSDVDKPIHVYDTAGTFTATLTVVDAAGASNSMTVDVTVSP